MPPLPDMDELPPAPDAVSPEAAAPPPRTASGTPEATPPRQTTGAAGLLFAHLQPWHVVRPRANLWGT